MMTLILCESTKQNEHESFFSLRISHQSMMDDLDHLKLITSCRKESNMHLHDWSFKKEIYFSVVQIEIKVIDKAVNDFLTKYLKQV